MPKFQMGTIETFMENVVVTETERGCEVNSLFAWTNILTSARPIGDPTRKETVRTVSRIHDVSQTTALKYCEDRYLT